MLQILRALMSIREMYRLMVDLNRLERAEGDLSHIDYNGRVSWYAAMRDNRINRDRLVNWIRSGIRRTVAPVDASDDNLYRAATTGKSQSSARSSSWYIGRQKYSDRWIN